MYQETRLIRTDRLCAIRKRHHFTQNFIADYLNVTRQCYAQYERGRRTPDIQTLVKLASLYNVSIEYLIHFPDAGNSACHPCFNNLYYLGLDTGSHSFLYLNPTEASLIKKFRCTNDCSQKEIAAYISCKAAHAGRVG